MMVMFAMLVTTFMVIVSHHRRNSELYARILTEEPPNVALGGGVGRESGRALLDEAFERLLTGSDLSTSPDNVIAIHSILENLYGEGNVPFGGTGAGYDKTVLPPNALLSLTDMLDGTGKPFALRPNILAPNGNGEQNYKAYLEDHPKLQMNPDYTAPDYMTMFLAWNDLQGGKLERVIPSFHRPQLVKYWNEHSGYDELHNQPHELRKYVLRPLPIDHPNFSGSNPAASKENLANFLTEGPWDVDNDGDGKADSIWVDIGLPSRWDGITETWYKPLVAFYVLDMDGRINVNTLGNLEQSSISDAGRKDARGMGLGTAELYSDLFTNEVLKDILETRYGTDKEPGGTSNDLLIHNGINLDAYTRGGLAADWYGTSLIEFNTLGNRVPPTSGGGAIPPIFTIPYLMNPYPNNNTDDKPLETKQHLEPLLRSIIDVDYNTLSQEFRKLLDDPYNPGDPAFPKSELRYNLTTQSSSIPVSAPLDERVLNACGQTKADALKQLLPEEIQNGKKLNLNRLTLSPHWATHWKNDATLAERNELIKEKARFAQEIFYLCRVLFHDKITETNLERLAQWSVNLVDFIDPDDVMTPFIFSTELELKNIDVDDFDYVSLIDGLFTGTLTTLPGNCKLIWGFEKPEVAITETFAVHDRRVTQNNSNWYQSTFRPQGSLYVKLHRQGNNEHRSEASSLVDATSGNLNLAQKTNGSSGDYVWRLAIGEATKTTAGQFEWNAGNTENNALYQLLTPDISTPLDSNTIKHPQFYQWSNGTDADGHFRPDLGAPERFIWFGNSSPATNAFSPELEVRQRSFFSDGTGNSVLAPGESLIIGPPDLPDNVTFPPGSKKMVATNKVEVILQFGVSSLMGVNVSEPLPIIQGDKLEDAYPNVNSSSAPPFDGRTEGTIIPGTIPAQRGTITCYKTITLQRLADPTRAHHPIGNPYITVDWSMIDLQVINSQDTTNAEPLPSVGNMYFSPRSWKPETAPEPFLFFNLWDRVLAVKGHLDDDAVGLGSEKGTGDIIFGQTHHPTLPQLLHFPWNDAPLMNTGELMLVPSSAPGRFGVEFHDTGDDKKFFGNEPRFGYHDDNGEFSFAPYLNWGEFPKPYGLDMSLLLDYVHVPSRFAGTIQEWHGEKPVYSMREPGKINLNTVTEASWNALGSGRTDFPDYEKFRTYREWQGMPGGTPIPSEFRPFRSPSATHVVPPIMGNNNALVGTPISATLFDWEELINNAEGNPYTVLEYVMRLSDITTSQSNVFAIWITVGYFDVEKFDNYTDFNDPSKNPIKTQLSHINNETMFKAVYPDGCILGAERGLSDGTVQRHRAFYLIDRSIPLTDHGNPVKFQRGDMRGTEGMVIEKTLLR
jgi:hypothetical protein